MTAERRLAKLEGALSPKAATLLWLAEAHQSGSLPAYVEWLIDQPISAAPLERVPEQARAAAIEAMRGQPKEVIREVAHQAIRDAIFGVELAWGSETPIRARTVPVRSADAVPPLPRRPRPRRFPRRR